MYLEENMLKLAKNKESLYNVLQEYSTKRTELIATLFTIFPITEVSCLFSSQENCYYGRKKKKKKKKRRKKKKDKHPTALSLVSDAEDGRLHNFNIV